MTKEEIAQNILDHFFHSGAKVSKSDWDFILAAVSTAVALGESYANMSNEI